MTRFIISFFCFFAILTPALVYAKPKPCGFEVMCSFYSAISMGLSKSNSYVVVDDTYVTTPNLNDMSGLGVVNFYAGKARLYFETYLFSYGLVFGDTYTSGSGGTASNGQYFKSANREAIGYIAAQATLERFVIPKKLALGLNFALASNMMFPSKLSFNISDTDSGIDGPTTIVNITFSMISAQVGLLASIHVSDSSSLDLVLQYSRSLYATNSVISTSNIGIAELGRADYTYKNTSIIVRIRTFF